MDILGCETPKLSWYGSRFPCPGQAKKIHINISLTLQVFFECLNAPFSAWLLIIHESAFIQNSIRFFKKSLKKNRDVEFKKSDVANDE